MREKFYVRKGKGVAGVMYDSRQGEVMVCGNMAAQDVYVNNIISILFIGRDIIPVCASTEGSVYKYRMYWMVSPMQWRVFKGNLEARDYVLAETRGFGRLMR